MAEAPQIVVIGAGPAGCSAAISLAKRGIACTILDKATFPRDKICGDALSLDVVNQLSMLSPSLKKRFDQSSHKQASYGVRIISPGKHQVDIPFIHKGAPEAGFVSERIHFDALLFDEMKNHPNISIQEGITIKELHREGGGWIIVTGSGSIKADLIIGADGAQSMVARKLGAQKLLPSSHSAGIRVYYEGVEEFHRDQFIELHFLKGILPGYLWVFPLPNGRANVGIGMLSSALTRKKINLSKALTQALENEPDLKRRFQQAKPLEKHRGFGLPLGAVQRKMSGDGYLLLGDAAGLIDPFSGEGIANAIRSGRVAAEVLEELLREGKAFNAQNLLTYDREIWKRVGPELKLSHQLQRLCRYPFLFDAVARKANTNQAMQEFLVNALSQVEVKSQLVKPDFWWRLLLNR